MHSLLNGNADAGPHVRRVVASGQSDAATATQVVHCILLSGGLRNTTCREVQPDRSQQPILKNGALAGIAVRSMAYRRFEYDEGGLWTGTTFFKHACCGTGKFLRASTIEAGWQAPGIQQLREQGTLVKIKTLTLNAGAPYTEVLTMITPANVGAIPDHAGTPGARTGAGEEQAAPGTTPDPHRPAIPTSCPTEAMRHEVQATFGDRHAPTQQEAMHGLQRGLDTMHAGGGTKRKSASTILKRAKRVQTAADREKDEQAFVKELQGESDGYWCDTPHCRRFFRCGRRECIDKVVACVVRCSDAWLFLRSLICHACCCVVPIQVVILAEEASRRTRPMSRCRHQPFSQQFAQAEEWEEDRDSTLHFIIGSDEACDRSPREPHPSVQQA